MTSKTNDSSSQVLPQGDNAAAVSGPQPGSLEHQGSRNRNRSQIIKSGPLFISSKGIGWTSWKKRWFILTRTSLVFFRSDPSATPQKGGEVNLTLGGIDLNNSASVEVKVDKKLLTVLFPDGRDGRAFTLKAETLEDLQEWKTALENAVQLAPTATNGAGQNGLLKNDQADAANGSADQQKDMPSVKSMVIGRPILLALEDIDGAPSFLEKALRYVEDHGVKVEGILRQAADVDDVHRRVREYEQGKTEFSAEEDAHVIGDCIKYILRELPSPPVPATCCNALLEAFRNDRNNRLNAMRTAILETFPEPNRRLLQRILQMMQTVASNKTVNRMSTAAVAACMSPLLLRPLLAGDCELENTHMDVAGDGSLQLLQAAAAANHAQAIIITLLDEYDNIFGEGSMSGTLFSDESGTGTEEASDDEIYDDDDEDDDDYVDDDDEHEYASDDQEEETDDDYEHSGTETCSESGDHAEGESCDEKHSRSSSLSTSPERANNEIAIQRSPSVSPRSPATQNDNRHGFSEKMEKNNRKSVPEVDDMGKSRRHTAVDTSSTGESFSPRLSSPMSSSKSHGTSEVSQPKWGRTSAKRNLSMESIDFALEDEDDEIQRLEAIKSELQNRITEEANGNAVLQASLERRKKALHERRLALEKDVNRLQEQLQQEKELRIALEAASNATQLPSMSGINEKTKNEIQEIALAEENFNNLKQRFDDLGEELNHQREHNAALMHDRISKIHDSSNQRTLPMSNKDNMQGASNHIERASKEDRNYSMDGSDGDNQSHGGHPKLGVLPNNSPPTEAPATKPSTSTSRKPSSKGEGGSATTSALSKLSNRLNFLKERRNQIAYELQFIDKAKGSLNQPALSPGKGKAPELVHNTDKNHGLGGSFAQNQDDHSHPSSQISTEGNNKDNNKKSDNNKRSSNSKLDAPPSSYSQSQRKGMPNEGDRTEGDNKDSNRKGDNNQSSNLRSDVPSSYNPGKEMPVEGYNKDIDKKSDNKRSSTSKSDAPSSYSSAKGMPPNEGDNKDRNKKADNKDNNKKGSSSKSEGNSNEYNRKAENRDSNKKGSNSKTEASPSQNFEQGRKSEYQSSQNLDRIKSEGQSSRSSDKGRVQDGQHSSTSRTLSR
ncbi:hypothetical protein RND81_03G237000 [Saponaria officinalis]|uniref:Rho GTPase-activating protein REN1 n=1 Tax=Saponaria officinalis TaxID=3572 RepID=A0AAW1M9V0_SAPOF